MSLSDRMRARRRTTCRTGGENDLVGPCPSAGVELPGLFVIGVLATRRTMLAQLQLVSLIGAIACGGVVAAFTVLARKRDDRLQFGTLQDAVPRGMKTLGSPVPRGTRRDQTSVLV